MAAPVKDIEGATNDTEAAGATGGSPRGLYLALAIALVTLLAAAAPGVVSIIQANVQGGEIDELKDQIKALEGLLEDVKTQAASLENRALKLDSNITSIETKVEKLDGDALATRYDNLIERADLLENDVTNLNETVKTYEESIDQAGDVSARLSELEIPNSQISFDAISAFPSLLPFDQVYPIDFGYGSSVTDFNPFTQVIRGRPESATSNKLYLTQNPDPNNGAGTEWEPSVERPIYRGDSATFSIDPNYVVLHPGDEVSNRKVMIRFTASHAGTFLVTSHAFSLSPSNEKLISLDLIPASTSIPQQLRVSPTGIAVELERGSNLMELNSGDEIILSVDKVDSYANDHTAVYLQVTLVSKPIQ